MQRQAGGKGHDPVPTGVRVWLATGHTDMRRGFPSLSLQVQEVLKRDPLSGHLFCLPRSPRRSYEVIWHDGQGAVPVHETAGARAVSCGRRPADGAVTISPAQLGYLLSGIDWRIRKKPGVRRLGRMTILL